MRFATVVNKSGKPDVHLVLVPPQNDASLQKAIKSHRVMMLHQSGPSDFGTVGFENGVAGQILVFPRSLKPFEGTRIVGIRYELLADAPAPHVKPAATAIKPTAKARRKQPTPIPDSPPTEKVVAFRRPPPLSDDHEENQRVMELEAGIGHAMEMLEAGREVAAFNVLKRLV